ncbi:MAG TPA: hypothetical protein VL053_17900 [Arachidicoccus sp.]|nr:hypothetical protein [Arachidicoccus sp.]
MKLKWILFAIFCMSSFFLLEWGCTKFKSTTKSDLSANDAAIYSITSGATTWSMDLQGPNSYGITMQLGSTIYAQQLPCQIEIIDASGASNWYRAPYAAVQDLGGGRYQGTATVTSANGSSFNITDIYSLTNIDFTFSIDRTVRVTAADADDKGFSSTILLQQPVNTTMTDYEFFVPGIWYKNNAYVNDLALATDYSDNFYWFREDRMPLPLFMMRQQSNNVTFSICHKDPDGTTFKEEDGLNRVIDGRMKFASVGMTGNTQPMVGLWYPGTEGERTGVYGYAASRRWAPRANPVNVNFIQHYSMAMRMTYELNFTDAMKNTWKAYYQMFNPPVYNCDLTQIYTDQVSMLNDYWNISNGVAGFPFSGFLSGIVQYNNFDLGFVGNQIANASVLIREGKKNSNASLVAKGEQVAQWWADNVFAPSGCPRNWYDPQPATWRGYETYARVVADGFSGLLWAWNFEKKNGVSKSSWLNACIRAGDWLITQQGADGSFPRAWTWSTNTVFNADKTNTSHLIPFLVDLYLVTKDVRYSNAALKAGNYIYNNDFQLFKYVGGTPDNPNVPDKEAASLALRAFLALYDLNKDARWMDAASQTAYYYETWVYSWSVPIPADDGLATYPKNRSSSGLSLIATSNNSADSYASVDAFNFYRMYLYKGDAHLKDMAKMLLYNTKQGLNWDRSDPVAGFGRYGMIEEAQSVMIPRGHGIGAYLPWQTFNMMEPLILLWDVFGANSYDISTIDALPNKNASNNHYSDTRGFASAY